MRKKLTLLVSGLMISSFLAIPVSAAPVSKTTELGTTNVVKSSQVHTIATATITGDGVRVRTSPSTSSAVLGLLYSGSTVYISLDDSVSGWYYVISSPTGVTGWISNQYARITHIQQDS
ncbi:SH3 domain-containing protein [Clostridium sp. 19966]|uniref:SH3 domain-containing protein n=1 Tax=Clostridium sp. 19966 TaxID=2768166 RepID=UPI0028DE39CD|nr:SH3 domain-containing protein [Clostridium sp. 19966]MDT8719464.1 SH3 domain-containing protein [Clostridium sp. 19966]